MTVAELLRTTATALAAAGVPEPRRDARLLVAAALEVEPAAVFGWPERMVSPSEQARLERLATRRTAREPVSRVLGRREFWSLEFGLGVATLDPRPESETLIEAALADIADRGAPLRLLDLGTGTGCLLLALLSELPDATGVGVDRAPAAAARAKANAAALGLAGRAAFLVGDWASALAGPIDLVVANPPYIPRADIATLEPEVRDHDPILALDGGADGLDAYRRIAPELRHLLVPGGRAYLELGAGQAEAAGAIAQAAGLDLIGARRDVAGRERCLVLGQPV